MNEFKSKLLILLDIDDVLFDTDHFKKTDLTEFRLYDDVLSVLKQLSQLGDVGILSQGQTDFQLKKLLNTNIHDRFVREHIYIVAQKDESLNQTLSHFKQPQKKIIFIDDRLTGLYYAKQAIPHLITIWLRRGRYAETQVPIDGFSPDATVTDFHAIIPLVKTA